MDANEYYEWPRIDHLADRLKKHVIRDQHDHNQQNRRSTSVVQCISFSRR